MKPGSALRPPRARRGAALAAAVLAVTAAVLTAPRLLRHGDTPSHTPVLVLRRGNGAEPESLDPHGARSEAALTILRDLYEGLTEIGSEGTPSLAAADQCTISPDGITYRFHLRTRGVWSNGDAVVAEDFAAAWRRLVDPRTGAQYAQLLAAVENAEAITGGLAVPATLGAHALDPSTLEVRLRRPTPYFLSLLTHPATFPIHRGTLAQYGRSFAKPGVMVSNGAFALARWDFGSHLVAVRNRRYWNDAATHVDRVEYYSITEPAAELRAFRSGALDVTSTIPGAQFDWVKQHLGQELRVAPQLGVYYLGLNLRRAPFATSRALRLALSLVIDRERLVEAVTATGESAAYTFVPPQTFNYSPPVPEYAGWSMARRIALARRLLADTGMLQSPPALELSYNSGELHARIAVAVAAMWKQALGIATRLHAEEFKVLLQDIDRGEAIQVFRASWLADYDDAYSFLQVLQSGFGINLPRYSSAAYDVLLDRAANEGDPQRRRALLQAAERVMLDDQPLIPLYFYVAKHLVSARVTGWRDDAMNVVYSKQLAKDRAQTGP
ncbi:MAG: peptide ABC transporter substrate-binding protein [Steroidobacteraceae bacterium]